VSDKVTFLKISRMIITILTKREGHRMNIKNFSKIIFLIVFIVFDLCEAEPSITIYNKDFAIVHDQINLDVNEGENKISITDITAKLEPDSIILRDPTGKQNIQILEQNYRSDPVSQELLLSLNEGKEIDFLSNDKIIRGKIIRSGNKSKKDVSEQSELNYDYGSDNVYIPEKITEPIIEVDGKLRFSLPGQPIFPSLADNTILKPTLHWILNTNNKGKLNAELSYITGGLSWKADYNLLGKNSDDIIDLIGWVTFDNQSGKTFENAKIKLMAGDINKIQRANVGAGYRGAFKAEELESVSETTFDEYHLYTLNRQTTLQDHQVKQVEFIRANNVKAERIFVYDGYNTNRRRLTYSMNSIIEQRDYGTSSNTKVWIMREIINSNKNHLGIPLPSGVMRFYKQDDDGHLEFLGENTVDHTPKDETIRVYTGNAFDLVGERKRIDYQIDTSRRQLDESFEIKVRNRKEKDAVEIRVVEHLYRWINWTITEKSNDFTKKDSQTVEFRVPLKPGEEKVITYKVRYTW
jgi:hypothetical protein